MLPNASSNLTERTQTDAVDDSAGQKDESVDDGAVPVAEETVMTANDANSSPNAKQETQCYAASCLDGVNLVDKVADLLMNECDS